MKQNESLKIVFLKNKAKEVRTEIIKMIYKAQSGHPGGSLSAADIVTVLYFDILNIDVNYPQWEKRDRFILSKGHACPVWYVCLAKKGFFPEAKTKGLPMIALTSSSPIRRLVPALSKQNKPICTIIIMR